MKPVCVPCRRFFKVKENGIAFVEAMPISGPERPEPGLAEPEKWTPYKLWMGDLYECLGCGTQIISGFGRAPIAEHYMLDFERQVALEGVTIQVNDC